MQAAGSGGQLLDPSTSQCPPGKQFIELIRKLGRVFSAARMVL